jgi:hypothetical protein|tara:strand:- start:197 stop:520 length:324 start_codon:yes stop_codon:yes gene_type:complete
LTPKLKDGESVDDLSLYSPRERTNIRLYGLAYKDYTPQMISEYRKKWAKNCETVTIRSKLDEATRWCKTNLYHHDFTVLRFANPDDSHSIHFKNPEDAMIFKLSFSG